MTPVFGPLRRLLYSRKVLLGALAVLNTVVGYYSLLPVEVWGSVSGFLALLIATIAWEDAAEKKGGTVAAGDVGTLNVGPASGTTGAPPYTGGSATY